MEFSSAIVSNPTFVAPSVNESVTLVFQLTVADGGGATAVSTVQVVVSNEAPTAVIAGGSRTVNAGQTVTLDGSVSTDPEKETLRYAWTAPDDVTLSATDTASPTFVAPEPDEDTILEFQLTVTDLGGRSHTVTAMITVNARPGATVAAPEEGELVAIAGAMFTLDGTGSTDPGGGDVEYAWRQAEGGPRVTLRDARGALLVFNAPTVTVDTTLTFELEVTDNNDLSRVKTVQVVVSHQAPVATIEDADRTVHAGATVVLDGSDSEDPEGGDLSYAWQAPSGVTLADDDTAMATFTAPEVPNNTRLEFALTVTDPGEKTQTTTATITVNARPTADAGELVNAVSAGPVTLDGSASRDPSGDALSYTWRQTPGTPMVTLSDAAAEKPTFIAPIVTEDTTLTFELTVSDGNLAHADTVEVLVTDRDPIAHIADGNRIVNEGASVRVDGSRSTDPDGGELDFDWEWTAPSELTLEADGDDEDTLIFTAPEVDADAAITFTLTVTDGNDNTHATEATITINARPAAMAVADPAAVSPGLGQVTLDGSGSADPGGGRITYAWTQTGMPMVTLSDDASVMPVFDSPEVEAATVLTFVLTVTDDNGFTDTSTVQVTVQDMPPEAVIVIEDDDRRVNPGTEVTLDGSGSEDPEDGMLGFGWTVPSRVTPTGGTTGETLVFTAPAVDGNDDLPLAFVLTVTDPGRKSDEATVTVTVNARPTANAGTQINTGSEYPVALDGSGSTDDGDGELAYAWTQTGGTPMVSLSDATAQSPTFTAPTVTQGTNTLTFELEVTDADGLTSANTSTVDVVVAVNQAPTATIDGGDRTVDAGDMVTLDGSMSTDPEQGDMRYAWIANPRGVVSLINGDTDSPTFIAPDEECATQDTAIEFKLTVTDPVDAFDTSDPVTITTNARPCANAGANQSVTAGDTVMLTGMASDPTDEDLDIEWTGPASVTLSNADTLTPTFIAPSLASTALVFTLTVTDDRELAGTDTVTVTVQQGSLRSVSISDDGNWAVSGGLDGTVRLWNVTTGMERRFVNDTRSLGAHDGAVYAVAISGDGTRVISGGFDGTVRLWNTDPNAVPATEFGTEIRKLQSSGLWVFAVALDQDGSHAAAGGFDGKVRFWETATGDEVRAAGTHTIRNGFLDNFRGRDVPTSVYAVALNRDGSRALTGGADGNVKLWDVTADGDPIRSFVDTPANTGLVFDVALSPDAAVAVAGSADNRIHVWDATNGDKLYTLSGHGADVSSVSINAAKTHVLSAGGDGTVRLWNVDTSDVTTDRKLYEQRLHTDYAWSASLARGSDGDSGMALSGGADGVLNIWDLATPPDGTEEDFNAAEKHETDELDVRPNDLGDVVGGEQEERLPDTGTVNGRVSISADGSRALSGAAEGTSNFYLWDTTNRERRIGFMDGHPGLVLSTALSADGRLALSGSGGTNNKVHLWNTETDKQITFDDGAGGVRSLGGHDERVTGVSLSADGRLALSGSDDDTLRLWDTVTGEEITYGPDEAPLGRLDNDVQAVSLSADGRLALSGDEGDRVRLWDTATGKEITYGSANDPLGPHVDVAAVSLSADGRLALSGGHNNFVRVWDTVTGDRLHNWEVDSDVRGVSLSADGRLAMTVESDRIMRFWDVDTGDELRIVTHENILTNTQLRIPVSVSLSADARIAISGTEVATDYLWTFRRVHTDIASSSAAAQTGEDQTVAAAGVVTLNGLESTDAGSAGGRPISYSWRQTGDEPKVALSATGKPVVTFVAPSGEEATELTFELTVTDDNGLIHTSDVSVTVGAAPAAPPSPTPALTADAGEDQTVTEETAVTLDGSGDDPDSGTLTYAWSQSTAQAANITLSATDVADPDFTAPMVDDTLRTETTLVFTLTVTSDAAGSVPATDTVSIDVRGADADPLTQEAQHGGVVRGVSVSRDGTLAVSGGIDGTVRLWNANTGAEITFPVAGGTMRSLGSHDGAVYAVAISADGTRAISGGIDGTVKLWTWDLTATPAATSEEVRFDSGDRSLGQGGIWVYAVALNEDGTRAASGGFDGKVRVWNTDAADETADDNGVYGEEITYDDPATDAVTETNSLGHHATMDNGGTPDDASDDMYVPASVYSVALSDDGSHVLSGGADGAVRLWNVADGTEVRTLNEGSHPVLLGRVFGVALSGDGAVAVAGGAGNNIHVWDAATGARLHTLAGHTADVTSVSINEDKTRVLSAGGDRQVRLWDVGLGATGGSHIYALNQHTDYAWSASLSGDGIVAISGGADGRIHLWNTSTRPTDTTETIEDPLAEPDHSPSATGDLRPQSLTGHAGSVGDVALSADGSRAATASGDQMVRIWDVATGTNTHTTVDQGGALTHVSLNADGSLAASIHNDGNPRLWDATAANSMTLAHLRIIDLTESGTLSPARSVSLGADGRLGVSGSEDNGVRTWSTAAGPSLQTITGHTEDPISVALNASGSRILSGSEDNSVLVWDTAAAGSLLYTMAPAHTDQVNSVALSANGSRGLSGSNDDTVRFWNTETDTDNHLGTMAGHTDNVTSVALSADGRLALSGSDDDTMRLWNTQTGELLRITRVHEGDVKGVALSADGRLALSGNDTSGGDGNVRLWRFGRSNAGVAASTATADAGDDAYAMQGTETTLDGGDSTGNVAYYWQQTSTADITLSADNVAAPTFTAPAADATLTFALTVTDAMGLVTTDTVTITVNTTGEAPPPSGSGPRSLTGTAPGNGSTAASGMPPGERASSLAGVASSSGLIAAMDVAASTACTAITDGAGRTVGGQMHGVHCLYPTDFLNADNPLGTDATIGALSGGGAHIFAGDLVVGDGATLNVQAGAMLAFEGASSLVIRGGARLLAVGSPSNPITFTSRGDLGVGAAPTSWGGLAIHGGDTGDSGRLEYVVVKHASGSGIELHGVNGTVASNLQVYAAEGDGLTVVGGSAHIENLVVVHARGDSINVGDDWSGSLTSALVIQSQHDGDHCLNVYGAAVGSIAGLTCITSSHAAAGEGLNTGIRLAADATPTIERSMVVGTFAAQGNHCLRIDNHAGQAPTLSGNIFACADKGYAPLTSATEGYARVPLGHPVEDSYARASLALPAESFNNQFVGIPAHTDPTAATDTHLQLLGGLPPIYSLDYQDMQINGADATVVPPEGADFPGAASESAPNWLRPGGIDWTYGIFEGSRPEPLWFEPTR